MSNTLPVINGRRLTEEQSDRMNVLVDQAVNGDEITKRLAIGSLREFTRELQSLNDAERADLDLRETVAMRRLHGALVDIEEGKTAVMTSLKTCYKRGHLDGTPAAASRLLEMGVLYGECFEIVMGLRTASKQEIRGSGGGAQEAIAAAGQILATLRHRSKPETISVMDCVCGRDMTIKETKTLLRIRFASASTRLRDGLLTAAHNRGL